MKRIRRWCCVGLVAVALAEIVLPRLFHADATPEEVAHFPFENWPAFGSLYGLASCVAIIVVSKILGKAWLMRREDFYDR